MQFYGYSKTNIFFNFSGELSMDQTSILQKAESNAGFVSQSMLERESGWDSERSKRALVKHRIFFIAI